MPAETVSDNVETLINLALAEDFGSGDVTSTYFVPEHLTARAILTPRKKGVLSGVNVAAEVFRKVDPTLKVEVYLHDGEAVAPGAVVMLIEGSARSILGAERTALNFIQRLSGVATLTRQYVKAISHTSARILDTRKTTPGYRLLEKAAVLHGGGTNHRMGLYDRAMVTASQGHGTLPQPGPAYPGKRNGRPACGAFSCCRDAPGERSPEQKRPDPGNLLPWQPCTGPRLPECCKDHFPIRLPERKAG